jgi:hypothetical protein
MDGIDDKTVIEVLIQLKVAEIILNLKEIKNDVETLEKVLDAYPGLNLSAVIRLYPGLFD